MRLLVALFSLLACGPAFAAEPFGRASIPEAERIVPGQQVHVNVEVFVPEFFTSPPQFPLFDAPDALVTLPDGNAQNMVQTIDGVQYSGIRRGYAVVPERAGSFVLPEIGIDLGYSSSGTSVKTTVRVALPSFEVTNNASTEGPPFVARNLAITQSLDRDASTLVAGDALVRTIVVFAEDTQAMLIPPVNPGQPKDLGQYLKPPVLADGVEKRGIGRSVETGSTRTQTVVYTTSRDGRFSLPEISYPWFDVEGQIVATATLPAIDVLVVPQVLGTDRIAPQLEEDVVAPGRTTWWAWLAALLACTLALAVILVMRRRSITIRTWATGMGDRRRNSPRRRLKRLRAIVANGGEFAIYRALQDWSADLGYATVSAWTEAQASPVLTEQVAILEKRLFRSPELELDRKTLSSAIVLPRNAQTIAQKSALPELNPTAQSSLLPPL